MSTVPFKQLNKYKHKEKIESDFELADSLLALKCCCYPLVLRYTYINIYTHITRLLVMCSD